MRDKCKKKRKQTKQHKIKTIYKYKMCNDRRDNLQFY